MDISIIILAIGVVGAFFIYKMAGNLIVKRLPDSWIMKLVSKGVSAILGFVYLYFSGYFIMDKKTAIPMAFVVAFIPWIINIGLRIISKEKLIED